MKRNDLRIIIISIITGVFIGLIIGILNLDEIISTDSLPIKLCFGGIIVIIEGLGQLKKNK